MGWEMLFEEFQDGRHGGSLKIWNGTILAILNLYVAPMPPIQFCLHPTYGLASYKSALNPRWFTLLTVLVPVLYSLLLVVYSTRRCVVCLSVYHFVLLLFSPFSIAITSLGEERANLSAFRTFVRFMLVWICRFPLPLGVWEGLQFVIVALPGLFSYLFFWEEMLFEELQDGRHGGNLKNWNGTILAIQNLHNAPMSHIKFPLNPHACPISDHTKPSCQKLPKWMLKKLSF